MEHIKIFDDGFFQKKADMETAINQWLHEVDGKVRIISRQTTKAGTEHFTSLEVIYFYEDIL
jgi:hypothetical protein